MRRESKCIEILKKSYKILSKYKHAFIMELDRSIEFVITLIVRDSIFEPILKSHSQITWVIIDKTHRGRL